MAVSATEDITAWMKAQFTSRPPRSRYLAAFSRSREICSGERGSIELRARVPQAFGAQRQRVFERGGGRLQARRSASQCKVDDLFEQLRHAPRVRHANHGAGYEARGRNQLPSASACEVEEIFHHRVRGIDLYFWGFHFIFICRILLAFC